MSRIKKKLLGFTLIEMLIVMTIFIILFGITISAFSGLRNTILMNETVESIKRNFRWTQRSALLLKRNKDEGWIYGIGIDLREYYTNVSGDQLPSYSVFKWCAPCSEFNGCAGASAAIPGDISPISTTDTNLPILPLTDIASTGNSCTPPYNGKLVYIGGSSQDSLKTTGLGLVENFDIPKPLKVATRANDPRFILFESVTGRVFYYNQAGEHIDKASNPTLRLIITPPPRGGGSRYGILMKQNSFSGKISTEQTSNFTGFVINDLD